MRTNSPIPEPITRRVETDYGDAGALKKTWIYLTTPNEFEVMVDWVFTLPNGQQAVIYKGFIYDGASIPFFLRPLMTSFGPLNRGGGIHDHGYRRGYLHDWHDNKIYSKKDRKFWDALFRDIVVETSHLKGLSTIVWIGVRTFGSKAWNKRRKIAKYFSSTS